VPRQGKIEALAYLRWLEIRAYNGYNKCLQFACRTGEVSVRKGEVAIHKNFDTFGLNRIS
jgi:hypothetical protein